MMPGVALNVLRQRHVNSTKLPQARAPGLGLGLQSCQAQSGSEFS